MTHVSLRPASTVMNLNRLGSMYESCFSFAHSLIRHMVKQRWQTKVTKWELNYLGHGTVIYELTTPTAQYSTIIFSNNIEDDNRDERVIATEWDITFALVKGTNLDESLINDLRQNVPKQEKGRYHADVLVLSRANKSVRMFTHILDRLSCGQQPDIDLIKQVGYIIRTTAVYGNGKFGIADFDDLLQTTDFEQSYRAQMYAVYVLRHFSIQWMEWMAKQRDIERAVTISPKIQQYLGIGNSTGLGMAPYLIRHPRIIDHWLMQRERALNDIAKLTPSKEQYASVQTLLKSAIVYLQQTITIDKEQQHINELACSELQTLVQQPATSMPQTWAECISQNEQLSFNAQELFISALLETYIELAEPYTNQMNTPELLSSDQTLNVAELIDLLERQYAWAIYIDFSNPDNTYWLWYQSKNKQEPRLAIRSQLTDVTPNQELPMTVAKQISELYQALKKSDPKLSIPAFLLRQETFASITRRVYTMSQSPLGEIQANTLSKETSPLDLLRAKLSFYGASKFDPRSDRWLRVTFFQGAPLLNKDGTLDKATQPTLFATIPTTLSQATTTTEPYINSVDLSCNELVDYGIRAIQAVNLNTDTVGVTNVIESLQSIGLLSEAIAAFERFDSDLLYQPNILEDSQHRLSIDLNQRSLMYHIEVLLEYALSQSVQNKQPFHLQLTNARNRSVCIGSLFKLANTHCQNESALFFQAIYHKDQQQNIIQLNDRKLCCYATKTNEANQSISIQISPNSFSLPNTNHYHLTATFTLNDSSNAVHRARMDLPLWQKIQRYANKNLVPITEQSESEAGGKS